MASISIVHIGDVNVSHTHFASSAHQRYVLLLHLPSFDLSSVATLHIIIDGTLSQPQPPFNGGAPLIVPVSGLRAGEPQLSALLFVFACPPTSEAALARCYSCSRPSMEV
jgi:hypothetical protein